MKCWGCLPNENMGNEPQKYLKIEAFPNAYPENIFWDGKKVRGETSGDRHPGRAVRGELSGNSGLGITVWEQQSVNSGVGTAI